ncbi:serine/threonine kinase-1, partial [Reticulomyxa filosa]
CIYVFICCCIAYCVCNKHSVIHEKLNLVHTDLKLENILLMDDSYSIISDSRHGRKYRVPNQTTIRLIDFGGATYEKIDEATQKRLLRFETINTRQYRAPEVILGIGWDRSSDLWSIGCILSELYTGDLLFATHENIEHLAMMEKVLECKISKHLVKKVLSSSSTFQCSNHRRHSSVSPSCKSNASLQHRKQNLKRSMSPHVSKEEVVDDAFFDKDKLCLRWPEVASSKGSVKHVQERITLKVIFISLFIANNMKIINTTHHFYLFFYMFLVLLFVTPTQKLISTRLLYELITQCLQIDREQRITAKEALKHPFFKEKSF